MIECVPNFSEGRRPEVLAALSAAASGAGARVLGIDADPDHHRSVLTFCGDAATVAEAAVAAVAEAVRRIDLRSHRGLHPRIGAADVVPFVPLAGHTLAEAAEVARRVGRRIADELGIPVYLYEAAAVRPERRNLADVRRGQFEGLGAAIATDPSRLPDFGPPRLHPTAGATAVGARPILIAYNIDLDGPDVAAARRIARAIRQRDGGLPGIKALGLLLPTRGRAQVSINVCDYRATSLKAVFDRVAELAEAVGVRVRSSQIVGLAPQEALPEAWVGALKLEGFDAARQILERAFTL